MSLGGWGRGLWRRWCCSEGEGEEKEKWKCEGVSMHVCVCACVCDTRDLIKLEGDLVKE